MALSSGDKLGLACGLVGLLGAAAGLAGAGVLVIAPTYTWVGWWLIGVGAFIFATALFGGLALAGYHFGWSLSRLRDAIKSRQRIFVPSMLVCLAGCAGFGSAYIWRENAASTLAAGAKHNAETVGNLPAPVWQENILFGLRMPLSEDDPPPADDCPKTIIHGGVFDGNGIASVGVYVDRPCVALVGTTVTKTTKSAIAVGSNAVATPIAAAVPANQQPDCINGKSHIQMEDISVYDLHGSGITMPEDADACIKRYRAEHIIGEAVKITPKGVKGPPTAPRPDLTPPRQP